MYVAVYVYRYNIYVHAYIRVYIPTFLSLRTYIYIYFCASIYSRIYIYISVHHGVVIPKGHPAPSTEICIVNAIWRLMGMLYADEAAVPTACSHFGIELAYVHSSCNLNYIYKYTDMYRYVRIYTDVYKRRYTFSDMCRHMYTYTLCIHMEIVHMQPERIYI